MDAKRINIGHKIIIEGIDGCGKSTLAEKIRELHPEMNYKIVHCTRHTDNNLRFFLDMLDSPENIIFDRFHIGQFVYQTSEQRMERKWLSLSDLEIIENKISSDGHEIIFVDTDLETCLINCLKDNDDSYYNIEYVKSLYDRYQFFFTNISQIGHEVFKNDFKATEDNGESTGSEKDCDYDSLPKIVAVDFDGCLVKGAKFPDIGKIDERVRYEVFEGRYKDYKKILWTSRSGESLTDAITFCQDNGMYFDAYNDNLEVCKKATGNNTRKVFASVYLDDKAVNCSEFTDGKQS